MDSPTPAAESAPRSRLQPWLALVGLAITVGLIAAAWPVWPNRTFDVAGFAGWLCLSVAGGFVFRVLRRKLFFAGRVSLHKAFSVDALFQAAILVNPQLRYPDVECEFLAYETNSAPDAVSPWFLVREAAAVVIPLTLAAATAAFAGAGALALVFALAALVWVGFRSASPSLGADRRFRFLGAVTLGIAASLVEGFGFVKASAIVYADIPAWSSFLLYAVMLAAFELSPVPFALGTLELAWLALAVAIDLPVPGLLLPEAYRLFRAVPLLLLMIFYLPRYKMSIKDLYDDRLAMVLARTRRRSSMPEESGLRSRPLLSIVIPAYNESERLPRYLPGVLAYCARVDGGAEVIVVDDGSKDATADYVAEIAVKDPVVRLVRQNPNRGKGAAVRRGVLESEGRFILFTDADGATPITECAKLLEAAQTGADIVIGSRKIGGGSSVHRERSILRSLVGSIFYRITNLLAVPGIEDTQCGFKLFTRSAARQIFPELRETGWAFDVEVLFLAQKFGMLIEELPVNWTAVEGSKIRAKDAIRMLFALLRIRHRASGLTTGHVSPR
jgi:dolichyl-phosphate beta-glucosyltransferase